jgi:hypothetical protein
VRKSVRYAMRFGAWAPPRNLTAAAAGSRNYANLFIVSVRKKKAPLKAGRSAPGARVCARREFVLVAPSRPWLVAVS